MNASSEQTNRQPFGYRYSTPLQALRRNIVQTRGVPCFYHLYRPLHFLLTNIRYKSLSQNRHPCTTTHGNIVSPSDILNIGQLSTILGPPLPYITPFQKQPAILIFHPLRLPVFFLSHPLHLFPETYLSSPQNSGINVNTQHSCA